MDIYRRLPYKYKYEFNNPAIHSELNKMLATINPEFISDIKMYHKNKLVINKCHYLSFKNDNLLWRNPYVCDELVYEDDGIKVCLAQEEYCNSTCDRSDRRCQGGSNLYFETKILYKNMKPVINKTNKFLVRDLAENKPDELAILLNTSKEYIDKWVDSKYHEDYMRDNHWDCWSNY